MTPASTNATETILVLDFGSQYAQLIARRVREAGAFSLLVSPSDPIEKLRAMRPKGIILSGGPASVSDRGAPTCDKAIFDLGVPVLGICYGMQLGCSLLGSTVGKAPAREYGRTRLDVKRDDGLMRNIASPTTVWMSHGDQVNELSKDFEILASTPSCPYAAVKHRSRDFWGVQFHPEVTHTPCG